MGCGQGQGEAGRQGDAGVAKSLRVLCPCGLCMVEFEVSIDLVEQKERHDGRQPVARLRFCMADCH